MARISFTSSTEEIIGKFGGNVFQDSYFGIQLRGLSKPRNPQTQRQQLRRGDFGFLSSSWRFLSSTDRNTWITEAGTVPEAKRLFIGNNINLILANIPTITNFIAATGPGLFSLEISELTNVAFTVIASGSTIVVPSGTALLLYATPGKPDSQQFVNPKDYYPLITYVAGTDFSSPVSIFADWIAFFGVLNTNQHICIKSVLVDISNGNRGPETVACANSILPTGNIIVDPDGYALVDFDGTFITFPE